MRKTANGTGRHIRLLIRKVLDLFFPRYCPVCDSLLAETEIGVCPRCMVRMPRYIEGMPIWIRSSERGCLYRRAVQPFYFQRGRGCKAYDTRTKIWRIQ